MLPLRRRGLRGIGRNVVVLGVVSLLTDVSSEMLYPILPLYLTTTLAAPMAAVGLIEGLAEGTASLLKTVSGRASDRTGRRLPFVAGGYALAAVSKPLLAATVSWPQFLGVRLLDRIGKGTRGPARDAMIAGATPLPHRGKAFGLHRALDTVGAVLGPLLGILLLSWLGLGYRQIFLIATLPAAAGVATLALLRRPPDSGAADTPAAAEHEDHSWRRVLDDPVMRRLLVATAVFAVGNSSNAFLLLRAADLGFSDAGVMWLYVTYNAAYALAATPAGQLSDRHGRRPLMVGGFLLFAVVYAGMALAGGRLVVWPLILLYGGHAAMTGSVARAWVADRAPRHLRGSAMGLYQTVNGVLLVAASPIAGALWSGLGPRAPFVYGAVTAGVAALLLALPSPRDGTAPNDDVDADAS